MALDGGSDGLDFYRVLADYWFEKLNDGGMLAVECGEEQTEDIKKMFISKATETKSFNDIFGLPRMVTAKK
jgi:release factor glutamine methyltransferase